MSSKTATKTLNVTTFMASADATKSTMIYEPSDVPNFPGSITIYRNVMTGELRGRLDSFEPSHVTHNDCTLYLKSNGIALANTWSSYTFQTPAPQVTY